MKIYLKKICLIFLFLFPISSSCRKPEKKAGFFKRMWIKITGADEHKNLSDSFFENVGHDHTRISRVLFKAYYYQKRHDRRYIENILNRCKNSQLYQLRNAFNYGAEDLSDKTKEAVWKISQDFASLNRSQDINQRILRYSTYGGIFIFGCYMGEKHQTWSDLEGIFRRILRMFES